jgi:excisionase family DNA binding protein
MKQTNSTGVSVREAALRLGCSQKWVRDLLYEQKLPGAQKKGKQWRIPLSAVEQRLKSNGDA